MGQSKSKCSLADFNSKCDLSLDPTKAWTSLGELEGDAPPEKKQKTSNKKFNVKKQIYVENGTTWNSGFKSFLLTLQKDLPEESGKLRKMFQNAKKAGDIVITHQKKLTQSVTITSYDTSLFVLLANALANVMMLWPNMSKHEASHISRSTVGSIVGSLESAGGKDGLYSTTEAYCDSYEFCLAIASEDDGDLIFQAFEVSMSNSTKSWNILFGLGSGQTDKFKISIERLTFVR